MNKRDKDEVDYSPGKPSEHCGNCRHFLSDDNACTLVKGHILSRMWCRLWSSQKKTPQS